MEKSAQRLQRFHRTIGGHLEDIGRHVLLAQLIGGAQVWDVRYLRVPPRE